MQVVRLHSHFTNQMVPQKNSDRTIQKSNTPLPLAHCFKMCLTEKFFPIFWIYGTVFFGRENIHPCLAGQESICRPVSQKSNLLPSAKYCSRYVRLTQTDFC